MQSDGLDSRDEHLLFALRQSNEQAFAAIFEHHHVDLFRLALKFVRLPSLAEDIVQDVLLYLWERRQELNITVSLQAYLRAAVKHRALDYLKSQYAQQVFEVDLPENIPTPTQADTPLQVQQLAEAIGRAIEDLPEKCRAIYTLSRHAELSYQEIADQLGLSVKTVEAQMGIALRKLRTRLQGYELLLCWLLLLPWLS